MHRGSSSLRRLSVVAVLAGLATVAPYRDVAHACTCAAPTDPRGRLQGAEGAFVGRLVARDQPKGDGQVVSSGEVVAYHFAVERAVKGDLGPEVDVYSAWSGASCGIETPVGARVGLLLSRDGSGRWTSNLCAMEDPDVLVRAAPRPRAPGTSPPTTTAATTSTTFVPPSSSPPTLDREATVRRVRPVRNGQRVPLAAVAGVLAAASAVGLFRVRRR